MKQVIKQRLISSVNTPWPDLVLKYAYQGERARRRPTAPAKEKTPPSTKPANKNEMTTMKLLNEQR